MDHWTEIRTAYRVARAGTVSDASPRLGSLAMSAQSDW